MIFSMQFRKYDDNIDYKFFEAHNVTIKQLMPWQFRLTHPDVQGRFVWYPQGGSLIYELPDWGVSKIGEFTDSEDVYAKIMEKA